jgi:hypothetical protein
MMNVIRESQTFEDAPRDGKTYVRKDGTWVSSARDLPDLTEVALAVTPDRRVLLGTAASYAVTLDNETATLVLASPPSSGVRDTILRASIINGGSLALPDRGYRRFGEAGPFTSDVRLGVRQYGDGSLADIYVLPPDDVLPNAYRGTIYTDATGLPSGVTPDAGALSIPGVDGYEFSGQEHVETQMCVCLAMTTQNNRGQYWSVGTNKEVLVEDYYGDLQVWFNNARVFGNGIGTAIEPESDGSSPNIVLVDNGAGKIVFVFSDGTQETRTFTSENITLDGDENLREILGDFTTPTFHYLEVRQGRLDDLDHDDMIADAAHAAGITLP